MDNVTSLVIKYKQTKSQVVLNEIFIKLEPMLEKKIKYVYYRKYYPLSMNNICKSCRACQDKKCRECHECTCIKGTFNLKEQNLCDLNDVRHDLILETMRIIEKFDITKDFNTYFIATLWNWTPSFLTRDMVNSITNKTLYTINEDEEKDEYIDKTLKKVNDFDIDSLLGSLKNDMERKIVHILLKNNKISSSEIALQLGLTKRRIEQIIKKIKNKISLLTN